MGVDGDQPVIGELERNAKRFDAGVDADQPDSDLGSHTEAGSMLGTPAFVPPEQVAGEIEKVDTRATCSGWGRSWRSFSRASRRTSVRRSSRSG